MTPIVEQLKELGEISGNVVIALVPVLLSLSIHEYAHAVAALGLGDRTALRRQRLSLNPWHHIDPIGSVLVPLSILLLNGVLTPVPSGLVPFVGWGRSVPVNTQQFSRRWPRRTSALIVALAGPLANLFFAVLAAGTYSTAIHTGYASQWPEPVIIFIELLIQINVGLFLLNWLPLFPLDGFRVLQLWLANEKMAQFERFSYQVGWAIVLLTLLIFHGPFAALVGVISRGIRLAAGLG